MIYADIKLIHRNSESQDFTKAALLWSSKTFDIFILLNKTPAKTAPL